MKDAQPISASVEDYLTAIYRLTPSGRPVSPTRLAEFMALSAPSISVMMRRLAELGLVVKDSARGLALSREGASRALAVLRRHRLCERFLVDKLGLDWVQAHLEAHRFEHALSDSVTDALERFLDHPDTCPHGNPIPDREGHVAAISDEPLAALQTGECAVVRRVEDDSLDLLGWLEQVGLRPGARLEVEQIDPGAAMLLRVEGRGLAVGAEVTRRVQVERVAAAVGVR